MNAEERESLARVRRAAIVAQRAIDAFGDAQEADIWLNTPCPALGGRVPSDMRYDAAVARRLLEVLDTVTARPTRSLPPRQP